MTTVDIDLFGKAAPPKPLSESVPVPVAPPVAPPVPPPPAAAAAPPPPKPLPTKMTPAELAEFALLGDSFTGPPHENILGTFDPVQKKWSNQVGEQKGSNPGGMFRGADGVNRYVKFYANPEQALMEDLTNRIYKDLGVAASSSELFKTPDGKLAYASDIVEGKKLSHAVDEHVAAKMLDGFAADVLVANWDAVGTGLDNVVVTPGGKPVRIDTGGSLLYRAQGSLKQSHLLNDATEWEGFFSPSLNADYKSVAKKAGVTSAEDIKGLYDQINKITALRQKYGSWKAYIDHHSPDMNPESAAKVVAMLEARTSFLLKKQAKMKGANLDDAHAVTAEAKAAAKAEEVAVTKAAIAAVTASPLPANASVAAKAIALKAAKAKASRDYRARKKGLLPRVEVEAQPTVYEFDSLKPAEKLGGSNAGAYGNLGTPVGIKDREEYSGFVSKARRKMDELQRLEPLGFDAIVSYTGSSYGPIRDSVRLTRAEWDSRYTTTRRSSYSYESAKAAHANIERAFDRVNDEVEAGKSTPFTTAHEERVTELYRGSRAGVRQ
jgi:hypothetical protein